MNTDSLCVCAAVKVCLIVSTGKLFKIIDTGMIMPDNPERRFITYGPFYGSIF